MHVVQKYIRNTYSLLKIKLKVVFFAPNLKDEISKDMKPVTLMGWKYSVKDVQVQRPIPVPTAQRAGFAVVTDAGGWQTTPAELYSLHKQEFPPHPSNCVQLTFWKETGNDGI